LLIGTLGDKEDIDAHTQQLGLEANTAISETFFAASRMTLALDEARNLR